MPVAAQASFVHNLLFVTDLFFFKKGLFNEKKQEAEKEKLTKSHFK
jgi:hypothetical protein